MRWLYAAGLAGITATLTSDIWCDVDYQRAADISLIYVAVLAAVFAVRYAFWSKWWTNRIGKINMAAAVLLALVLLQGMAAVWWTDEFPGRQVARFVIYSMGATAYVPMIVALVREQRRTPRTRTAQRTPRDG